MERTSGNEMALIRRCQSGDPYALDELFSIHYRKAFTYALKMTKHSDDASDVVAEGFIKIHRAIRTFQAQAAFSTWMYRILRNCFIDIEKRKKRGVQSISLDDSGFSRSGYEVLPAAEEAASPFEISARAEALQAACMSLNDLPPSERVILRMYYQDELSYREIAAKLKKPIGTIKSRMHTGRNRLQRLSQTDTCLSAA